MRYLVTGASGFVGTHLVAALRRDDHEVIALGHGSSAAGAKAGTGIDVRDERAVADAVRRVGPQGVFHLAAQSSAALSWAEPRLTYETNVTATHYLLEAVRQHAPEARVLLACTSDSYGAVRPADLPIEEDAPLRPLSPYASSKLAAEGVGRMFHAAFGLGVVITRAFMHIGPGQPPSFATAEWARRIARAEAGLEEPVVEVGNLDLARELGDVRDVVRAYRTVLEHGAPGEAYNVATGEVRTLRQALDILTSLATVPIEVRVDPNKLRPADPSVLEGSSAKLERLCGWKPEHRLEDTLADVLDHWRAEARR